MTAARERIAAAYKNNNVMFRSGWRATDMTVQEQTKKLIDEGVMDVGVNEQGADYGRKYTKRELPW
jgi:hypothetical protein